MMFFVISEWNGQRHHHLTTQPPYKAHSPVLAQEVERYELADSQAHYPMPALIELAERGALKRYVPPASIAIPPCFITLGLRPGASVVDIEAAYKRLMDDAGDRPIYRYKIERARRRALDLTPKAR